MMLQLFWATILTPDNIILLYSLCFMTAIEDANILSGIKPFPLKVLAEIKHKPYSSQDW